MVRTLLEISVHNLTQLTLKCHVRVMIGSPVLLS